MLIQIDVVISLIFWSFVTTYPPLVPPYPPPPAPLGFPIYQFVGVGFLYISVYLYRWIQLYLSKYMFPLLLRNLTTLPVFPLAFGALVIAYS